VIVLICDSSLYVFNYITCCITSTYTTQHTHTHTHIHVQSDRQILELKYSLKRVLLERKVNPETCGARSNEVKPSEVYLLNAITT